MFTCSSLVVRYYNTFRLVAGVGIGLEALFDDVEVGLILSDDVEKGFVLGARLELGDEADEEGDLELDLVGVDAVEDAV